MNVPSCMVPPTNGPYGNSYKPSWRNHLNLSWGPEPPQYAPPASSSYASTPQSQPPQSISPIEQAILNLTKLVGDFVKEQKTINAQLSQKIDTMENNVNNRIDRLQSEMEHKFDNLQYSISRHTNQQHVHQEEVNLEEECLIDTTVEEQCKQQREETSPMLTEEGSGKEQIEEPQNSTALATNSPLPEAPSPNLVYTMLAAQPLPEELDPAAKAKTIPSPLPILQNFRKLVATAQLVATTSKKLAAAHTAWHSGWFGCWFRYGAPGPRHFCKLH